LALLSGLAFLASTALGQASLSTPKLDAPGGTQLAESVQKARAQGETKITTPAAAYTQRVPPTLDEAVAESRVVIARADASTTTVDTIGVGLVTWDKLHVIEVLHDLDSNSDTHLKPSQKLPKEMGSLSQGDIVLSYSGGTAIVDGVMVTTPSAHVALQKGKTYLLFLNPHPSEDAYFLMFGSDAIYQVVGSRVIPSRSAKSNLIGTELKEKFGNDLISLKSHFSSTQR
jgi:hypothetical protein